MPATPWVPATTAALPVPNAVAVYRLPVDPTTAPTARALLAPEELARADRFHFDRDRARYTIARAGLRRLLGSAIHLSPLDVPLRIEGTGKPVLPPPYQHLHFNLSHSQDLILYALSTTGPVGIDVEWITDARDHDAICRKILSANELREYEALPPPDRPAAFFSLWARKEAIAKACGQGLAAMLQRIEVPTGPPPQRGPVTVHTPELPSLWILQDLAPDPHYAAAVAAPGPDATLTTATWTP
jgi:4'-phosphopantetheinyl transferase